MRGKGIYQAVVLVLSKVLSSIGNENRHTSPTFSFVTASLLPIFLSTSLTSPDSAEEESGSSPAPGGTKPPGPPGAEDSGAPDSPESGTKAPPGRPDPAADPAARSAETAENPTNPPAAPCSRRALRALLEGCNNGTNFVQFAHDIDM